MIKGQGTAIVCAVGPYTQIGMSVTGNQDEAQNEHLKSNDTTISSYKSQVSELANIFGFVFFCLMIFRKVLTDYLNIKTVTSFAESFKYHDGKDSGLDMIYLQIGLDYFLVTICMIMVLVPSTIDMTSVICLTEYSKLQLFKNKDLLFRNQQALEVMGRVNCICFERQGTISAIELMHVEKWFFCGIETDIRPCNYIIDCLWFSSIAWVEEKRFKGNKTEKAILKFLKQQFKAEFEKTIK